MDMHSRTHTACGCKHAQAQSEIVKSSASPIMRPITADPSIPSPGADIHIGLHTCARSCMRVHTQTCRCGDDRSSASKSNTAWHPLVTPHGLTRMFIKPISSCAACNQTYAGATFIHSITDRVRTGVCGRAQSGELCYLGLCQCPGLRERFLCAGLARFGLGCLGQQTAP